MTPQEVHEFWFGEGPLGAQSIEARTPLWFAGGKDHDQLIRARFETSVESALAGGLLEWAPAAHSRLSLIIVLDQFTRSIYRGTAEAFAGDARALKLATAGVEQGMHTGLHIVEQMFFFLPFEHAEDVDVQQRSVDLFEKLVADADEGLGPFAQNSLRYAVEHRDIIARFGRFPHRNRLLGRASTAEEERYLSDGAPTFGQ